MYQTFRVTFQPFERGLNSKAQKELDFTAIKIDLDNKSEADKIIINILKENATGPHLSACFSLFGDNGQMDAYGNLKLEGTEWKVSWGLYKK